MQIVVHHSDSRIARHHSIRRHRRHRRHTPRTGSGGGQIVTVHRGIDVTPHLPAGIALVITPHIGALTKENQIVGSIHHPVAVGVVHIDGNRLQVGGRGDGIVVVKHRPATAIHSYVRYGNTLHPRHIGNTHSIHPRLRHSQSPPVASGKHRRLRPCSTATSHNSHNRKNYMLPKKHIFQFTSH